jgi:nucleoporin GLE1
VLLFLLNHFAKNIVEQLVTESAVDSKSADSIGVLAAMIFARPQYLFNGQSLIDILWAKYHKHCPVLFGISGSEKTKEGRARLGWHIDRDANSFVREQEHHNRMSGLGVGFAAITLRDFSKSQNKNPAPNRIFWESLARIINTPANEVQPTHFIVLKAMITNYVPRIIKTFGGAGVAALRQALIAFPNDKGPQDTGGRKISAVKAVQAMPSVLQKELHLTL